jgi:hypothetical protein
MEVIEHIELYGVGSCIQGFNSQVNAHRRGRVARWLNIIGQLLQLRFNR